MRIDQTAVALKSNPTPRGSIRRPEHQARIVRPGIHGATGCHTKAKSPYNSARPPRPIISSAKTIKSKLLASGHGFPTY
jgi:hypothetical protein